MLKLVLIAILPLLLFFGDTPDPSTVSEGSKADTGTLRKLIPENGTVSMTVNLGPVGARPGAARNLVFAAGPDSMLPILVFDNELRTTLPGSMSLVGNATLPRGIKSPAAGRLVLETTPWDSDHQMLVRDEAGHVLFFVEGLEFEFRPDENHFSFQNARLLLAPSYATELGIRATQGNVVGTISLQAAMRPIEVTSIIDGEVESVDMPASPSVGTVPGPDVIVGELLTMEQPQAATNGFVGLGIGTTSCNFGTIDLDWFRLSNGSNDHPVIPQNLYRMSGGANNNQTFEQIGQSWLKHAFTALTENACGLGCNGVGGTHLGSGCSDPYVVSLNYAQNSLGSRAWVNPFTGAFPVNPSPANHTGHTHISTSHRMMVAVNDLSATQNPGATYWGEAQYVTPHEYVWCQAHPGQCNMYNNVSYKQYTPTGGPTTFTFPAAGATQRQKAAIEAWTGATLVKLEPAPGSDGVGTVGYKVTNPSPGVWHYEYAIYNQSLDRGVQSFSLAMGVPVIPTGVAFHAPPQEPAFANDGTFNSGGYSTTPWASTKNAGNLVWSTETFAQNQNANAIRWGTLYNFRFDANFAPMLRPVTIGFFKTGDPIVLMMQVPTAMVTVSGRVLAPNGRGISAAKVTIQDSYGYSQQVTTNKTGGFTINNVPSGGSYTMTAVQRRYTFTPTTVQVDDAVTGVNLQSQ